MDTIGITPSRSTLGPIAASAASAGSSGLGDLFASIFNQMSSPLVSPTDMLSRPTASVTSFAPAASEARSVTDRSTSSSRKADHETDGGNTTEAKPADDQNTAKSDDGSKAKGAERARTAAHAKSAAKGQKVGREAKSAATEPAAQADATDATTAPTDKMVAKDDTGKADDAGAGDAGQDAPADNTDADGVPIPAVVPLAMPLQIARVAPGGGGTAAAPAAAGGLGGKAVGPALKAGPAAPGAGALPEAAADPAAAAAAADQAQAAAGADPAAAPSPVDDGTPGAKSFASMVAAAAAVPVAQTGAVPRTLLDLMQPVAAPLVVPVATAGDGGGAGGDGGADLTGDNGTRGGQAGAAAPDANAAAAAAGAADGARPTSGTDFAGQLASVRSARPGSAAGATDQVSVQLKQGVKDGNGSISMQLRPEELGRIDIHMDIGKDGVVSAMITADRPQTLELLQRDSHTLERALQDAGLQTDSGSLSFGLRGEGGQGFNQANDRSGNGDRPGAGRNGRASALADDGAVADVRLVTQRYQVAPGRVDVRI